MYYYTIYYGPVPYNILHYSTLSIKQAGDATLSPLCSSTLQMPPHICHCRRVIWTAASLILNKHGHNISLEEATRCYYTYYCYYLLLIKGNIKIFCKTPKGSYSWANFLGGKFRIIFHQTCIG